MQKEKKISYTLFVEPNDRKMCKLMSIKLGLPENKIFRLAMKMLKAEIRNLK
jgi:hypothetical protein